MKTHPFVQRRDSGGDLGARMLSEGLISGADLTDLRQRADRHRVPLADVLRLGGGICPDRIAAARAAVAGTTVIDPVAEPPDPRLVDALGPETCLRCGLLPWRRAGAATVVLSARPEEFDRHVESLTRAFGTVRMAVAREDRIQTAVIRLSRERLVRAAETAVPADESCRYWSTRRFRLLALVAAAAMTGAALRAPEQVMTAAAVLALVTVVAFAVFRIVAAVLALHAETAQGQAPQVAALPKVSLLIPLFHEREIAAQLVRRLARIDYPPELLDLCLILETDDRVTGDALDRVDLPANCRVVAVPAGKLRTKPRALNYALTLTTGAIVGVYDAEDAPEPDQVRRVVARFAQRDRRVACVQGVLDFYNPSSTWISRCFSLEYATWFRIVLPGLARMGWVVPLGGTSVFLRRDVLEEVGGWDAHNVTEDADLGLRLARHGYRTELIDSVTAEEANGRVGPWIRQRSRWLKGYAITYAVHMRAPVRLWRDLGWRRFLGVQLVFLGTLVQFVLAPVLWSFWLVASGLPHPLDGAIPTWAGLSVAGLLLVSGGADIAIAAIAARRSGRRWLMPWALTLPAYFMLGTVAVYRALWELAARPFYWHKTKHGIFAAPDAAADGAAIPRLRRRGRRASAA